MTVELTRPPLTAPAPTRPGPARPGTGSRPGTPPAGHEPARARRPRRAAAMPHFPALDGLRGLAVLVVVLFHAEVPGTQGGFLGVSTFFTLSGFLITSLLIGERASSGRIDLGQFWVRRVRRLLPASLAALALVAAFGLLAADPVQRRNLAGDVLAALGYAANWRFLLSEQSYADVFGSPSPVLHFWSLAIEEQFYVLFPAITWLALVKAKLRRQTFTLMLGALTLGSAALAITGPWSTDARYYATPTRAVELLVGALLATVLYDRRITAAVAGRRSVQRVLTGAGAAALAACAVLWVTTPQSADWLYRGGFTAYSLLTALLIVAALVPRGAFARVLANPPLRALGRISYGVYLYHWPVFLWLDADRTSLDGTALLAARLGVTVALALVSFHVLESPIRHGRHLRWPVPLGRLAPVPIAAIGAAVVALTITAPQPVIDFEDAETQLAASTSRTAPKPAGGIDPANPTPPKARVALFGDSTALMTGLGLAQWGVDTGLADSVDGGAKLGCGIGRGGARRDKLGTGDLTPECNRWNLTYKQKVETHEPTLAVVQMGPWEVADRKLEGETQWRAMGDPVYEQFLLDEMLVAVDTLSARGAVVVWLTSPPIGTEQGTGRTATEVRGAAGDPARMERLNALIRRLPELRPGKVELVDLAGWVASTGEDARLRVDGVHFDPETSTEVAGRFLGPALLETYRTAWAARAERIRAGSEAAPATSAPPAAEGAPVDPYLGTAARRVLVVGDDNAAVVADGLQAWAGRHGVLQVTTHLDPACGVLRATARNTGTALEPVPAACAGTADAWVRAATTGDVDLVVVVPSRWDLAELRAGPEGALQTWGDPAFEQAAAEQFNAVVSRLIDTGAIVTWLNLPGAFGAEGIAPANRIPPYSTNRLTRYDETLKTSSLLFAMGRQYQRVDTERFAARWTRPEPLLDGQGNLDRRAAAALGEWLAPELLVRYDDYLTANRKIAP